MKLKDLAVKHAYYCNVGNFYSNECVYPHETFKDFLDEMGDADLDYNLLFRFDIKEHDKDDYEEGEAPDGFYGEFFIMQQRKGRFVVCKVKTITEDDVQLILAYLEPRYEYLKALWEPLK